MQHKSCQVPFVPRTPSEVEPVPLTPPHFNRAVLPPCRP
jgi:hypothetical protein